MAEICFNWIAEIQIKNYRTEKNYRYDERTIKNYRYDDFDLLGVKSNV